MDEKTFDDPHFGAIRWNPELACWRGAMLIPPHEDVVLELLPEYVDSSKLQLHIHETMGIVERDELSFREKAADYFFENGFHLFWWPDDLPFVREAFVRDMHLSLLAIGTDYPSPSFDLWYEYGDEIMEHGIIIHLSWNGVYQEATET